MTSDEPSPVVTGDEPFADRKSGAGRLSPKETFPPAAVSNWIDVCVGAFLPDIVC